MNRNTKQKESAPKRGTIVRRKSRAPARVVASHPQVLRPWEMTADRLQLVANLVCRGATPDELRLVAHVAERTRLDPLRKQLWAWKEREACRTCGARWHAQERRYVGQPGCPNCRGEGQVWALRLFAGKAGLLAIARRHGDLVLFRHGVICEGDTYRIDQGAATIEHVEAPPAKRGKVYAAWCLVQRRGQERFLVLDYASDRRAFWARRRNAVAEDMPLLMYETCAIRRALAEAYPEDLSDVYTPEEFGGRLKRGALEIPALAEPPLPAPAPNGDGPPTPPLPEEIPAEEEERRRLVQRVAIARRGAGVEGTTFYRYLALRFPAVQWPDGGTCGCDGAEPGKLHYSSRHCGTEVLRDILADLEAAQDGLAEITPDGEFLSGEALAAARARKAAAKAEPKRL